MKIFSKEKLIPYALIFLFVAFFLYIIFSYAVHFLESERATFQIKRGSIRESFKVKGFIFRDEALIKCKSDGYVLYVYKDKSKVSRNDVVLLSSKNEFEKKPNNIKNSDNQNISQDNAKNKDAKDNIDVTENSNEIVEVTNNQIYDEAKDYVSGITELNFSNSYNVINDVSEFIDEHEGYVESFADNDDFKNKKLVKVNSRDAGIISYNIDGYESLKIEDYNEELLYAKNHRKINRKAYLNAGDEACKVIKSYDYKVVFDSSDRILSLVNEGKKVKAYIPLINKYIETKIEKFESKDGKTHFYVSLDKYLDKFLDTRVIDLDIVADEKIGLKITNNCIYNRNCIVIDKNFVYRDDENDEYYIYKVNDDSDFNKKNEKIILTVTYQDDDNIYILYEKNKSRLNINDKITKNNQVYNISKIKSYKGVICLNKGYEVFRIINVICENNEYSIIKEEPGSMLKVYDMVLVNVDI